MAGDLPDVNVWIALSHPDHARHSKAKDYWNGPRADRLALTRPTMFGLLRGLANPAVMGGHHASPSKAWFICQTYLSMPDIGFVEDSIVTDARVGAWTGEAFFSGKLWTDAWIAALAMEHDCRVVSFDSDFSKFPGLKFLHLKV